MGMFKNMLIDYQETRRLKRLEKDLEEAFQWESYKHYVNRQRAWGSEFVSFEDYQKGLL
tara:strand:+ start:2220 stop:2396 length:177 start_codon:yes stop_codon:yes gene_type:complete